MKPERHELANDCFNNIIDTRTGKVVTENTDEVYQRMVKLKVIEIYFDTETGETIVKERKELNQLSETAWMDLREDLIHDIPKFLDRVYSVWENWWNDNKNAN